MRERRAYVVSLGRFSTNLSLEAKVIDPSGGEIGDAVPMVELGGGRYLARVPNVNGGAIIVTDAVSGTVVQAGALPDTTGWSSVVPVSIRHRQVAGDLTDFPMLLTGANFPDHYWATVQSDGRDIRFRDASGTPLRHELVSIDTAARTQQIWVKVPAVSSGVNTELLLFYGNPAATMPTVASQQAVWADGYYAAWSFDDAAGDIVADRTGQGNTGTKKSANEPVVAPGKVGNAQQFDGANDYIIGDALPNVVAGGSVTISAWVFPTTLGSVVRKIFAKGLSGVAFNYGLSTRNGSLYATNSGGDFSLSTPLIVTGQWQHACVVFSPSGAIGYVNGVPGPLVNVKTQTCSATQWAVGVRAYNALTTETFAGLIDELRVSSVSRSNEWVSTEYNNQSSPGSFYSVGTPMADSPSARTSLSSGQLLVTSADGLSIRGFRS